eukprot:scaffold299_cov256-Amphora_coffeaeformis.AAC.1
MNPRRQDKAEEMRNFKLVSARISEIFDPFAIGEGHRLAWENLTVEIGGKVIIENLSGEAVPGNLTAVMGHSGSGKTTLLRALGGRGPYTGKIFLDGESLDPSSVSFQRRCAFVADNVALEDSATCFESIRFSARLRLPASFSEECIDRVTNQIIAKLRLTQCANTQCRFLSMGEKRRASLALELVVRPDILLLDEPTSGLDSHNGIVLLQCLREVADSGCCVLMSVHHPNIQMFESIDHVILIHEGRCMLQCGVQGIPNFFEARGCPVPDGENPADLMLTISQTHAIRDLEEMGFFPTCNSAHPVSSHEKVSQVSGDPPLANTRHDKRDSDEESEVKTNAEAKIPTFSPILSVDKFQPLSDCKPASPKNTTSRMFHLTQSQGMIEAVRLLVLREPTTLAAEVGVLLKREWNRTKREGASHVYRVMFALLGGSVFGVVFQGAASQPIESVVEFNAHAGALFFFLFCGAVAAPSISMEFLDRRPMFDREYRTCHYRVLSFAVVNMIRETVIVAVQAFITCVVAFWAVGFQGRFWYMYSVYFANAWSFVTIYILFASIMRDPRKSKVLFGLEMFPQGLFCGFYVAVSQIPRWLRWLSRIMPLFYTLRLFLEEEFSFCAVPRGRDKHLMDCLYGLEDIFDFNIRYTNESVFTLAQTGIYRGGDGIQEYLSLFSRALTAGDELLYDTCIVKDNFRMIVHDVSESHCSITTANVLQGYWNDAIMTQEEMGHQSVFSYRLLYTPKVSRGPVRIEQEHLFWANPFQSEYPVLDVDKVAEQICSTLENNCDAEYFQPFHDHNECVAAMKTLPDKELNVHGEYNFKGNSTGCRMVHGFMARKNSLLHCAHLSWYSQMDAAGNYKCDDKVMNLTYYNWTAEELELFQQVGAEQKIFDEALARNVPEETRLECIDDTANEIFKALVNMDEFDALNGICYNYLQENDALPELKTEYWLSLLVVTFCLRGLGIFLLRRNSIGTGQ